GRQLAQQSTSPLFCCALLASLRSQSLSSRECRAGHGRSPPVPQAPGSAGPPWGSRRQHPSATVQEPLIELKFTGPSRLHAPPAQRRPGQVSANDPLKADAKNADTQQKRPIIRALSEEDGRPWCKTSPPLTLTRPPSACASSAWRAGGP